MLTTNEAMKFCGYKSIWQFRYAIKKAGISHAKIIGSNKMWSKKDLTKLIKEKKND